MIANSRLRLAAQLAFEIVRRDFFRVLQLPLPRRIIDHLPEDHRPGRSQGTSAPTTSGVPRGCAPIPGIFS